MEEIEAVDLYEDDLREEITLQRVVGQNSPLFFVYSTTQRSAVRMQPLVSPAVRVRGAAGPQKTGWREPN